MNEARYQVAIKMEMRDSLSFPHKCAYCLELLPAQHIVIDNEQLKGFELKVPYCIRHYRIINRLKMLDKTMLFFLAVGMLALGIYLHNHQVIVIGNTGFNFITAEIIFVVTYVMVSFMVRWLLSRANFSREGTLDSDGAVIITGVYTNALVLEFHNQRFAAEFAELNKPGKFVANSEQNQLAGSVSYKPSAFNERPRPARVNQGVISPLPGRLEMGAWGPGSLENDDASDWLGDFCDEPDKESVSNALSTVAEMDADVYPEVPECSVSLAAAEVIAALKGAPAPDMPHEVKECVSKLKVKADPGIISLALRAVERIKTNSELKELWDKSESSDEWYAALGNLEARLRQ